MLVFIKPFLIPQEDCLSTDADVYLVVYSVTDAVSFSYIGELLPRLKRKGSKRQAVFIVANKQDLVRGRVIGDEGTAFCFVILQDVTFVVKTYIDITFYARM